MISGCGKKEVKTEYYPQYVRPKKCAKAYDIVLKLKPWIDGPSLGSKENADITINNVYYLIYQIQKRDATIQCQDEQSE